MERPSCSTRSNNGRKHQNPRRIFRLRRLCRKIQTKENHRRLLHPRQHLRRRGGIRRRSLRHPPREHGPPLLARRRLPALRLSGGQLRRRQPALLHHHPDLPRLPGGPSEILPLLPVPHRRRALKDQRTHPRRRARLRPLRKRRGSRHLLRHEHGTRHHHPRRP